MNQILSGTNGTRLPIPASMTGRKGYSGKTSKLQFLTLWKGDGMMDEKKVREAMGELQIGINAKREMIKHNKVFYPKQDNSQLENDIEVYATAIEALKKQLPRKPIIKSEKEVPHTHNLGRLLRFHCPNCGRLIISIYKSDVERGGGISNRVKGCSTCLQAIDFLEYYPKDKLNEELQWDD